MDKIRQSNWNQLYAVKVLKWEKVSSVKPPVGTDFSLDAIYSLRITQARRATAYRDLDFIRFLTVAADHDSTYRRWFTTNVVKNGDFSAIRAKL